MDSSPVSPGTLNFVTSDFDILLDRNFAFCAIWIYRAIQVPPRHWSALRVVENRPQSPWSNGSTTHWVALFSSMDTMSKRWMSVGCALYWAWCSRNQFCSTSRCERTLPTVIPVVKWHSKRSKQPLEKRISIRRSLAYPRYRSAISSPEERILTNRFALGLWNIMRCERRSTLRWSKAERYVIDGHLYPCLE